MYQMHGLIPLTRSHVETLEMIYSHMQSQIHQEDRWVGLVSAEPLLWNNMMESMQGNIIQKRGRWFIIQLQDVEKQKIKAHNDMTFHLGNGEKLIQSPCEWAPDSYVIHFWLRKALNKI